MASRALTYITRALSPAYPERMAPWPRRLKNFPIILLATVQQIVTALALELEPEAHLATAIHLLTVLFNPIILPVIFFASIALVFYGFNSERKATNLLCLVPQQLLLYLSAGGSLQAIWLGHFATGSVGPPWMISIDQGLPIFLALFHTWAMFLILKHGVDRQ